MAAKKITFRGKAVTIACTDLKRSERFYARVLGGKRLPGDGLGCTWLRVGEVTLSLMPNAEERSPAEFPTHAMPVLWLVVDDLAAAHRHLRRNRDQVLEHHEDEFMLVVDP